MSDSIDSEQVLLRRAREFDLKALAEIYDTYSDELYRYAWRQLSDQDLAEDCISETFSRFLHAVKQGKGPGQHLRAYLFRTAHNWIVDYYRRSPVPELPIDLEIQENGESEPPAVVMRDFELQEVRDALTQLTPDQRQVIVLKYLHEWDNAEIAHAMEKNVGAVKALQHRAISALKRLLVAQQEVR